LSLSVATLAVVLTDLVNNSWAHRIFINYITVSIIIGVVVRNFVGLPNIFQMGVSFSFRKLLRLAIILLGIKFTMSDATAIGVWAIPIVGGCILMTLGSTLLLARLLKVPERLAVLIAMGTSICGVSAIVATAPVIKATDEETAYAVTYITIFGIMAMFIYPYVAHFVFEGSLVHVGLFLGTAIHDTSQVVGAGLMYDQKFPGFANLGTLDVAVVTKLVRNMTMVVLIPATALLYARRISKNGNSSEKPTYNISDSVPVFVVGFLVMVVLRSVGDAGAGNGTDAFGIWGLQDWNAICGRIRDISGYVFAVGMAGLGLSTSFAAMKNLGMRPFGVGLTAATVVGVTSVALVFLFGSMVKI
jgi:uncharacterized integral membrane protein (TIGR00698 family)